MNWDSIQGNWKEFKGKAKQQWGKLTDDDLDVIDGKRQELEGRLQKHYGYAKDQAKKEVDTWLQPFLRRYPLRESGKGPSLTARPLLSSRAPAASFLGRVNSLVHSRRPELPAVARLLIPGARNIASSGS